MSSLRFAFTGDVHLAPEALPPNISPTLINVLSEADHLVVNLEGPIPAGTAPIEKKGPVLRQSEKVLDLLEALGVDIIGLANNHIADHGRAGIRNTLDALSTAGLHVAGAGTHIEEIYSPLRLESHNATVSLLFAAEYGFGCAAREETTDETAWGYAWLFDRRFGEMVCKEAADCDFVVIVAHAGVEGMDYPLPQWRETYQQLVDMGASAIIAHHPHVTQGYEIYKGAPIFYSIGNFCFLKPRTLRHKLLHSGQLWRHGQVPVLSFTKGAPVEFVLHHTRIAEDNTITLDDTANGAPRTERLSEELASPEYDALVEYELLRVWKRRYGPWLASSSMGFQSFWSVARMLQSLALWICRRATFRDPLLVQHLVDIESHRWAISETMNRMHSRLSKSKERR